MVRTTIQLTENQSVQRRAVAVRQGVSVAALIRRAVDIVLSRSGARQSNALYGRAVLAAGRFRSGAHDAATRHDTYLSDEYVR
jgi:hypothetical protein